MKRTFLSALIALAGLAAIGAAIFATQIGIAHNPSWGRGRTLVLILGSIIILGALALIIIPEKFLAAIRIFTTSGAQQLKPVDTQKSNHKVLC